LMAYNIYVTIRQGVRNAAAADAHSAVATA
jgi:hypothetical protein